MFDPDTEVKHLALNLKRNKGKGDEVFPALNILVWEERGKFFLHCLELDIVGDGQTLKDAQHALADLLITQIEFAEQNKTELYHPAPKEYWQKLHQIQANQIRQRLHTSPPRSVKEVLEALQPVYA